MTSESDPSTGSTRVPGATGARGAKTVTRFTHSPTDVFVDIGALSRRAARQIRSSAGTAASWVAETVSIVGALLIVTAIIGGTAGATLGWAEAWVSAIVAGILLFLSVPFLWGGHDYRILLDLDRDRVVAGSSVTGHLRILNRSRRIALPGRMDIPVGDGLVEAQVPLLFPGAQHREYVTIAARRRGVIDVGPITVSRGDPLGILRREISWPEIQRIFVHPVTVPIPSTSAGFIRDLEGRATTDIVDSDLSFHAIREYARGDSQRNIHWRSTAKTGTLMVRQYEESRRSRIAILLGVNKSDEYGSDGEFEMAVSAAASLGFQGIRDGRDVLVATSAEITELQRERIRSIKTVPTTTRRAMLDGFSEIEMSDRAMRLEEVATLAVSSFPELSLAFLITGSLLPIDRLRSAWRKFTPGISVVVLRCEPGAEPGFRTTPELSILTIGALHDLEHLLARGAAR